MANRTPALEKRPDVNLQRTAPRPIEAEDLVIEAMPSGSGWTASHGPSTWSCGRLDDLLAAVRAEAPSAVVVCSAARRADEAAVALVVPLEGRRQCRDLTEAAAADEDLRARLLEAGQALLGAQARARELGAELDLHRTAEVAFDLVASSGAVLPFPRRRRHRWQLWAELVPGLASGLQVLEALAMGAAEGARGSDPTAGRRLLRVLAELGEAMGAVAVDLDLEVA